MSATAAGARVGRCFKRTSAASSQRTIASSRKSSASATSANAEVVLRGRRLDLGVALHDLDHVPAVHLQDLVDVGPGDLQRDQHLDHELVARGRHEVGRRAKPVGQLALAGGRDPVPLPRPLAFAVVGLDEPVPFEALEGRVDLPDVQRPDLARPRLELVLQPQAVLRPLAQQGKEGMGDAHEWLRTVEHTEYYTQYIRERKWRSQAVGGASALDDQRGRDDGCERANLSGRGKPEAEGDRRERSRGRDEPHPPAGMPSGGGNRRRRP